MLEYRLDRLAPQVVVRRRAVEGGVRAEREAALEPLFAIEKGPDELVIRIRRFLGQHVETGRRDAAAPERVVERIEIDDWAARGVDDDQPRLRGREGLCAEQPCRLVAERRMHTDDVGDLEKVLEAAGALQPGRQFETAGLVGVVEHHVHAEALRAARGGEPDAPEPEDAEHGGSQPPDRRRDRIGPVLARIATHRVVIGGSAAGQRQHQRDRVIGHFRGAVVGHVEDRDAACAPGRAVDRVVAHARAEHAAHIGKGFGRKRDLQHRRIADQPLRPGGQRRRDLRSLAVRRPQDVEMRAMFGRHRALERIVRMEIVDQKKTPSHPAPAFRLTPPSRWFRPSSRSRPRYAIADRADRPPAPRSRPRPCRSRPRPPSPSPAPRRPAA